jgi:hypothetical protein
MPEMHFPDPRVDKLVPLRSMPLLLQRIMTLSTFPRTVMVAKAAFQRLEPGPEELTQIILEEIAAPGRVALQGEIQLTATERRGRDGKGLLR